MTLTKRDVQQLTEHMRFNISQEQEALILERFGSEPDEKHVWTGQDIYEQVRKLLCVRMEASLETRAKYVSGKSHPWCGGTRNIAAMKFECPILLCENGSDDIRCHLRSNQTHSRMP